MEAQAPGSASSNPEGRCSGDVPGTHSVGGVKAGFLRPCVHLQPHKPVPVLERGQIAVIGKGGRVAQRQGGVVQLLDVTCREKHPPVSECSLRFRAAQRLSV